jgi:hypothetical protein
VWDFGYGVCCFLLGNQPIFIFIFILTFIGLHVTVIPKDGCLVSSYAKKLTGIVKPRMSAFPVTLKIVTHLCVSLTRRSDMHPRSLFQESASCNETQVHVGRGDSFLLYFPVDSASLGNRASAQRQQNCFITFYVPICIPVYSYTILRITLNVKLSITFSSSSCLTSGCTI